MPPFASSAVELLQVSLGRAEEVEADDLERAVGRLVGWNFSCRLSTTNDEYVLVAGQAESSSCPACPALVMSRNGFLLVLLLPWRHEKCFVSNE